MYEGGLNPFKLKLKFVRPTCYDSMKLRPDSSMCPLLMLHLAVAHPFRLRLWQPVCVPCVVIAHDRVKMRHIEQRFQAFTRKRADTDRVAREENGIAPDFLDLP